MPITSIGSYIVTGNGFDAHWTDVNTDRVANTLPELTLQGGFTRTGFRTDLDTLQTDITNIEDLANAVDLAASDRDAQKENVRDRMSQFRAATRLHLQQTRYASTVPTLPNIGAAESKFVRPFEDMLSLWTRINADTALPEFTPPLLLQAGYTLAGFTTDLDGLRAVFREVIDTENDIEIARKNRDTQLEPLRERMLQYRVAIELEYGPGHPFFDSLPDLYAAPGSTPDPVTASGQWDDTTEEAVLTWTGSSNPNLEHYEIRVSPGPTYDLANASVAGQVLAGTEEFRTTQELTNPGDTASFKIYVVLSTGNEAGSETVVITRP